MCGIAGYFSKNTIHGLQPSLAKAIRALAKRGPDLQQSEILSPQIGFAHSRLSIIDTSDVANQPMHDSSGRFSIIFNGEIFNFRQLKEKLLSDVKFNSASDTEVLLNLYIKLGKNALQHLNGFFAFAIYDWQKNEIFLARDRFGIKPLHIYQDEEMLVFASELKAMFQFPIQKEIDFNSLALYLQLNYIPGESSILKRVQKLKPGHYAVVDGAGNLSSASYYHIPYSPGRIISEQEIDYETAKSTLKELITESVERRLVSDVPIGTFLSGGIDSSIVTACASKFVSKLNTFSIGYADEPYFDETHYANLVAKKFNTNHTVFSISTDEILSSVFPVLDYIDEPFADSSSLAVFVLSNKTRQNVTVALSGDGGDELFGGYNKHQAELRARQKNILNSLLSIGQPVLQLLPKSRHSKLTNFFRQLSRYSNGLLHSADKRYWNWCTLYSQQNVLALLKTPDFANKAELERRVNSVTSLVKETGDVNDILFADTQMVLPNDMLVKVDLMSMANSLEVRVPLLDYTIVDFAFSLPASYKISSGSSKKILKDAFRDELPYELFTRNKKGFEVPLLKWLKIELHPLVENDLLSSEFVIEQGIFNYTEVQKLKQKIFSADPGDTHAQIWALLVFQYWYKKYFLPSA